MQFNVNVKYVVSLNAEQQECQIYLHIFKQ